RLHRSGLQLPHAGRALQVRRLRRPGAAAAARQGGHWLNQSCDRSRAMRALIVGCGSVGIVLAHHLERTKGNEIAFLVRKGRKQTQLKLLNAKSDELHVRERPAMYESGARLPPFDTVILAVRADQVDEAASVLETLPATTRIVSASAGHDD